MELFLESFPKIFISGIVMTLPLAVISFVLAMILAIFCLDTICESSGYEVCCSILYLDI